MGASETEGIRPRIVLGYTRGGISWRYSGVYQQDDASVWTGDTQFMAIVTGFHTGIP
jgi:hypothetical protein